MSMLITRCPDCETPATGFSVTFSSIPASFHAPASCSVCKTSFDATATNSYLVPENVGGL